MADTLLFRGGSTADVNASTVSSRELVIDTDTDQIVSGASKKRTVMEQSNGDVEIGGGNIELNTNGSATFAGGITAASSIRVTDNVGSIKMLTNTQGEGVLATGTDNDLRFQVNNVDRLRLQSNGQVLIGGSLPSTPNIILKGNNGSAQFAGSVSIGGTLPSSPNIELNADGSGEFASLLSTGSIDVSQASASALGVSLSPGGLIRVQRPSTASSNTTVFQAYNGSTSNISLYSGGAAQFAGSVSIGGTAAANTIDEYEEGTWTPVHSDPATTATLAGQYRLIGNLIYIRVSASNGTLKPGTISGLPFSTIATIAGVGCKVLQSTAVTSDVSTIGYSPNLVAIKLNISADIVVTQNSSSWQGNFTSLLY